MSTTVTSVPRQLATLLLEIKPTKCLAAAVTRSVLHMLPNSDKALEAIEGLRKRFGAGGKQAQVSGDFSITEIENNKDFKFLIDFHKLLTKNEIKKTETYTLQSSDDKGNLMVKCEWDIGKFNELEDGEKKNIYDNATGEFETTLDTYAEYKQQRRPFKNGYYSDRLYKLKIFQRRLFDELKEKNVVKVDEREWSYEVEKSTGFQKLFTLKDKFERPKKNLGILFSVFYGLSDIFDSSYLHQIALKIQAQFPEQYNVVGNSIFIWESMLIPLIIWWLIGKQKSADTLKASETRALLYYQSSLVIQVVLSLSGLGYSYFHPEGEGVTLEGDNAELSNYLLYCNGIIALLGAAINTYSCYRNNNHTFLISIAVGVFFVNLLSVASRIGSNAVTLVPAILNGQYLTILSHIGSFVSTIYSSETTTYGFDNVIPRSILIILCTTLYYVLTSRRRSREKYKSSVLLTIFTFLIVVSSIFSVSLTYGFKSSVALVLMHFFEIGIRTYIKEYGEQDLEKIRTKLGLAKIAWILSGGEGEFTLEKFNAERDMEYFEKSFSQHTLKTLRKGILDIQSRSRYSDAFGSIFQIALRMFVLSAFNTTYSQPSAISPQSYELPKSLILTPNEKRGAFIVPCNETENYLFIDGKKVCVKAKNPTWSIADNSRILKAAMYESRIEYDTPVNGLSEYYYRDHVLLLGRANIILDLNCYMNGPYKNCDFGYEAKRWQGYGSLSQEMHTAYAISQPTRNPKLVEKGINSPQIAMVFYDRDGKKRGNTVTILREAFNYKKSAKTQQEFNYDYTLIGGMERQTIFQYYEPQVFSSDNTLGYMSMRVIGKDKSVSDITLSDFLYPHGGWANSVNFKKGGGSLNFAAAVGAFYDEDRARDAYFQAMGMAFFPGPIKYNGTELSDDERRWLISEVLRRGVKPDEDPVSFPTNLTRKLSKIENIVSDFIIIEGQGNFGYMELKKYEGRKTLLDNLGDTIKDGANTIKDGAKNLINRILPSSTRAPDGLRAVSGLRVAVGLHPLTYSSSRTEAAAR